MNKKTKDYNRQAIHKINNILTGITLTIEMIMAGTNGPISSQQKKHLTQVLSEIKEIAAIIKKQNF